jgi:putative ABC transport system substrate-binding protein
MRRREFITLLGGAAAAPAVSWPLPARAQQVRRIGVLMSLTKDDPEDQVRVAAFEDGLKQLGWVEGRNLHIEYRWYAGEATRARILARELIEFRAEVIMVAATPGAVALQQETRTIPMVFVTVSDPAGLGLVENLARPGGNATGSTFFEFSVAGKLLEVLKQAAPGVERVAVIYNPQTTAFALYLNPLQSAASSIRVQLVPSPVREPAEIDAAIEAIARETGGGGSARRMPTKRSPCLIALAARHKLPRSTTPVSSPPMAASVLRHRYYDSTTAANHVDRILKGANPGELPVQQPAKYELVLNLKTAKALGLTIPLTLQVTADEVIE